MSEINRIVKNLCSNASFDGGTTSAADVDKFLVKNSDLYFCRGKAFKLTFNKITNNTYKIGRKWV